MLTLTRTLILTLALALTLTFTERRGKDRATDHPVDDVPVTG